MHSIIDGDSILFQSAYNVGSVEEAFDKFVGKVQQLTTVDWDQTGDSTIFLEGPGNWRKSVFPGYKANRKHMKEIDPNTELREQLANFLKEEKLVITAVGCESDDLVRRKAEHMRNRGQPYVVVSADKDLDMVVGPHIKFNPQWKVTTYEIDEEQSDYNYFYQLMYGDHQDYIRHPYLLGPATIRKLLKENPREKWKEVVQKQYIQRCGDDWYQALMFTGSLIHIQRWKDDFFVWDKKRGNWWDCGFDGPPSCYDYTEWFNGNLE